MVMRRRRLSRCHRARRRLVTSRLGGALLLFAKSSSLFALKVHQGIYLCEDTIEEASRLKTLFSQAHAPALADVVLDKGQQGEMPRPLHCHRQRPLVLGTGACLATRLDLRPI